MNQYRITILHDGRRIRALVNNHSSDEALAEICDHLGIELPTYASVVKVPE